MLMWGGGIFGGTGRFQANYAVFEGHGKSIIVGMNSKINHSIFPEIFLEFADFFSEAYDSIIIRNCIFAGYRPWNNPSGGAQLNTVNPYFLDSSKTVIRKNLFYTGIGDSTWAMDPPAIVDVWVKGKSGNTEIKGRQWPGNGNLFGDPRWVKYNYVGPSPVGISDNDYHLQPGSPAIGAASDGTNIGAY